jgi:hypothetical protein
MERRKLLRAERNEDIDFKVGYALKWFLNRAPQRPKSITKRNINCANLEEFGTHLKNIDLCYLSLNELCINYIHHCFGDTR